MAFTYTTRQGERFYLHARQEARGGGRTEVVHYFAPELDEAATVDGLPAGYSVVEERGLPRLVRSATAERFQARQERMADPRARREAKRAARRERYENRTRPTRIDWMALALGLGLDPDAGRASHGHALRALEEILGEENVRAAVELRLGFNPGWNVAEAVLRAIRSELATDLAYEAYRSGAGDRAVQAVALIEAIGHPKSVAWAGELLADERVAEHGAGLLAELARRGEVERDRLAALVAAAEAHASEAVRERGEAARRRLADGNARGPELVGHDDGPS
jgi:hypothetical protein